MPGKEKTENYLKVIYRLQGLNGDVRCVEVAEELKVSKATVSIAVHELEKEGYITISCSKKLKLTSRGIERAIAVTEKYDFFMDMLKFLRVNDKIARKDACQLEHSLSDESFRALKMFFQNYMSAVLNMHNFTKKE